MSSRRRRQKDDDACCFGLCYKPAEEPKSVQSKDASRRSSRDDFEASEVSSADGDEAQALMESESESEAEDDAWEEEPADAQLVKEEAASFKAPTAAPSGRKPHFTEPAAHQSLNHLRLGSVEAARAPQWRTWGFEGDKARGAPLPAPGRPRMTEAAHAPAYGSWAGAAGTANAKGEALEKELTECDALLKALEDKSASGTPDQEEVKAEALALSKRLEELSASAFECSVDRSVPGAMLVYEASNNSMDRLARILNPNALRSVVLPSLQASSAVQTKVAPRPGGALGSSATMLVPHAVSVVNPLAPAQGSSVVLAGSQLQPQGLPASIATLPPGWQQGSVALTQPSVQTVLIGNGSWQQGSLYSGSSATLPPASVAGQAAPLAWASQGSNESVFFPPGQMPVVRKEAGEEDLVHHAPEEALPAQQACTIS